MRNFFSIDGKFFSVMDKIANLFWLNILFIICCIPVFTIGASTTALFYVTMKMVKDEDSYITKSFFHSFRQNFKQATGIWLLVLAAGVIFFVDMQIMKDSSQILFKVITVIIIAMAILFLMIMIYIFPLLAKFDNSVKNTIKNSLLISITNIPWTLLLIVCIIVPFVLAYFIPYLIPILLLMGAAGIAFGTSYIYVRVFSKLIPEEEENADR